MTDFVALYQQAMLRGDLAEALRLRVAHPDLHDQFAEAAKRRHLAQYSQPVRTYRNVAVPREV